MENAAIVVEDLQKTFKSGLFVKRRVHALRGVSFSVDKGTVFGLLGPNGAGKTTLIKVLLGIVRKTGGQATLLGRSAGDLRGRRQVGYLPENHRIPHHLTANTALEYYGSLSGLPVSESRRRTPELLERVGLSDWGTTLVKKYSKGMLQRLGLAQAMLHDPDLLILDEPTDGVDPVGRREMREILQELRAEGKTIFINSHLLQEVELVCDQVAVLKDGQLRRVGSVAELTHMTQDAVRMTLRGSRETIQTALSDFSFRFGLADPLVTDRLYIEAQLPDQTDVDRCLDRLRQAGVAIEAVQRPRLTLEEAFVDIVSDGNSDAVAGANRE